MQTDNEKIMISVKEISTTLGWPYTTVKSIIDRKSPKDKLATITECEQKLTIAKKNLKQEFQNN